ncbi:GNAT family N-acetyltransferase [Deinococcus maricopensis]|uniref:GCN5-related N-acetyltransferase n=1 Tax=Deinococcus maricopensis (strain DSM 21211 / LMG 22137 / NRRL B-23946 / LB-34) TaxID=709986 RepID=E8U5P0_DEIML|nr:GNAT family protein [Deinococcus maricopensis]ADV66379.1 GCN5-related N-acetyltransferase [Deinococcus maricopensis DSM 21211]
MPTPDVPGTLRTARLLLRGPRVQDAAALHAAIHASLPELQPWMTWAQTPPDLPGAAQNLANAAHHFQTRESLRYLVWDAAGTTLIGSSGYHALDWRVPKGELGYWIATAHTGHGYATEVARALTDLALGPLGFRRLEIRCDSRNERSARIPRALGYTLDATFRHDDVAANDPTQLRDTLVFARVP